MLEDTLERGVAPSLGLLAEHGRYRRAISTFPSLTPVCLSALATGAHPDVHEIPHLVWYHRGEQRLVEYGSSFGAVRAAGTRQSLIDTIYGLNASHLGSRAVTVYEALEDAGLTAAAINITCYRGRHAHRPTVPFLTRPAHGPSRFFFYNLFESDVTGAPLSVRNRPRGTIDAYAAAVGRWLVTRDGFDFLVFYLSDYDYASHAQGPDAAHAALARCDEAVGTLIEAAGGRRRVPRALRRHPLLRPRPDAGERGRAPAGRVPRRARDGVEPRRDGLHRRRSGGPRAPARRQPGRRRRPPARRRQARRAARRSRRRRLAARPSRRSRARGRGAREPERRRADRLGRGRLGVRRPRRAPPLRWRLARVAPGRRLRGADARRRARRAAGLDRRGDAGRARPLRRPGAAVRAHA